MPASRLFAEIEMRSLMDIYGREELDAIDPELLQDMLEMGLLDMQDKNSKCNI